MTTVDVDARFAGSSGIGVYLRNILHQLGEIRPNWRFRLFGTPERVASNLQLSDQVSFLPLNAPYYSIREQIALMAHIGRGADAVWSPHYNAALLVSNPLLVTIHDVNHLALPGLVKGLHRRLYAKAMFEAVRRRADGILFVSEFSRSEFERLVGPLRCPSWITYNAAGGAWTDPGQTPEPGANGDYIVYVGNVKPHKNLMGLLQAFSRLQTATPVDLVIVGRREGFLHGDPATLAFAEQFGERVRFTGEVSDEVLKAYVANARALVMPSFYEGFGLPPLEAMAAGCPTIVSNAASLPEVCGEASAYFNPHDPADIARAIAEVLGDGAYAERLRAAGRLRAQRFSWRASAQAVAEAIEATLARRRRPSR